MEQNELARRVAAGLSVAGGVVCAGIMAVQSMGLKRGTGVDHMAVLVLLLALAALALALFWRETRNGYALLWMALPVLLAMLLRCLCLDYESLDYQDFLSHWGKTFQEYGGFQAIAMDVGDYNAPYLYFMAAISYLDFPHLYAVKLFSCLFDVLLAWGCLRLTRTLRAGEDGELLGNLAFALALLLPTVVLNGSYWGQCDSTYGALTVLGLAALLMQKPRWGIALLAVAFSFKLQTIFVLPLLGALWLGKKIRFRDLWVFPGVYVLTILPAFLLGKPLKDILGVYFDQVGEYNHRLTLNAPSWYQFIPYGKEVDETLFSRVGIMAAFAVAVAMLVVTLALKCRLGWKNYYTIAMVLVIGIPFLLPHMHERYYFLADMLSLCWACANWKKGLPVFLLAAGSSLLSYLVYLRLEFNHIFHIGDMTFVMGLEAAMMLGAFLLSLAFLCVEIRACTAKPVRYAPHKKP